MTSDNPIEWFGEIKEAPRVARLHCNLCSRLFTLSLVRAVDTGNRLSHRHIDIRKLRNHLRPVRSELVNVILYFYQHIDCVFMLFYTIGQSLEHYGMNCDQTFLWEQIKLTSSVVTIKFDLNIDEIRKYKNILQKIVQFPV